MQADGAEEEACLLHQCEVVLLRELIPTEEVIAQRDEHVVVCTGSQGECIGRRQGIIIILLVSIHSQLIP